MKREKVVDFMIEDQDTNCTFIVDVEGHKYLLGRDVNNVPDVPSITVSGLIVTISGIDIFNEVTVSGITVESPDVYVTVSGVASENFEYEEIYIQGGNSSNFPNTNNYYYILGTNYVVQPDEVLHITALTAAQTKKGLSTIALYRDSTREREIPMMEDIHVVFPVPHRYYEGETIQVRFKPKDKKTRIQVFVDGYITEETT